VLLGACLRLSASPKTRPPFSGRPPVAARRCLTELGRQVNSEFGLDLCKHLEWIDCPGRHGSVDLFCQPRDLPVDTRRRRSVSNRRPGCREFVPLEPIAAQRSGKAYRRMFSPRSCLLVWPVTRIGTMCVVAR
jgi:hypothetical protein